MEGREWNNFVTPPPRDVDRIWEGLGGGGGGGGAAALLPPFYFWVLVNSMQKIVVPVFAT